MTDRSNREPGGDEGRYRELFDRAPLGYQSLDAEGVLIDVNPAWLELLGYTREEVVGRWFGDFLTPASRERFRERFPRFKEAGATTGADFEMVRKDGQVVLVNIDGRVGRDKKGRFARTHCILNDMTERHRFEEDLRRERDRAQAFLDVAEVALLALDARGRITMANQKGCRILGRREDELVGRDWFEVCIPKRQRDEVRAVFAAIMRGDLEPVEYFENTIVTGSGEERLVAWHNAALKDDCGAIVGTLSSGEDITERRLGEEALRSSEERLTLALETTGLGLWDWNLGTGSLTLSRRWAGMLGFELEDIEAEENPWESRIHPDDLPAALAAVEKHLSGRRPLYESEHRLRSRSGDWIWVHDQGRVVERDEEGRPLRIIGTQQDVTVRRAAEEEHLRLVAAVDQAAESILVTDVDGTIRYVNPAFTAVTGYSAAEAVGGNPRILNSGCHDQEFYQEMWTTLLSGRVWHGRLVNRRKDGSLYEEISTISPVRDRSGAIVNFVAVKRDVTKEMMLQEQLTHAQKMEAVGRLAGGVAHDFNNLLQGMLGLTKVLCSAPDTPFHLTEKARELEEHVKRGAQLTRQLLLFSRRDTARPELLDFNEIVRSALALLRRLMRENIRIESRFSKDALALKADRGQLEQVIVNLAVNAADAMPAGGVLSIATAFRDDGWVVLKVRDSGVGILEELRERIFEPFFTTKEADQGTGLGLAVVHGIVTRHGGSIELESIPGVGTVFTVLLPAAIGTPAALGENPGGLRLGFAGGRGERIILVEDERVARESLAAVLGSLGYVVDACASGEEAERLPVEPAGELLLTDLSLPGIHGRQLAELLLARWPALRVILMSGYAGDDVLQSEVGSGTVRFLQKPFEIDVLAREVRAALDENLGGQ